MTNPYAVDCDYGGIGNYQEGDTTCLLCPNTVECAHETELAELAAARQRRAGGWRYPEKRAERRPLGAGLPTASAHSMSPASGYGFPRRPMPVPGESTVSRMAKNTFATILASGFGELAAFWSQHNFAPTIVHVYDAEGVVRPKKE